MPLLEASPPELGAASPYTVGQIAWFFTKAGAFVFGSGLAIVPFLYTGVVHEFQWLDERQFRDAVAVAMITPGPVVITAGFIGYLAAGLGGAVVAAAGTFVPPYLVVVLFDVATVGIAAVTLGVLFRVKRLPEPVLVLIAGAVGLLLKR